MLIPDNYGKINVPEKKAFELLPDDIYRVRINKIDLKENVPVYNSSEVEDRLLFEFVVVEEGEFKNRKLWQECRPTMSAGSNGYSPSWLYKLFCAVNKINLTDEEAKAVSARNINELLNKELRLVVKQEKNRKGEPKNKIKDMLPLKANTPLATELLEDDVDVSQIPF